MIFVPEQSSNVLQSIIQNAQDVINFSLVLSILSKKFSPSGTVDDVFSNSCWLSELEVTINKIGKIGEVKSKIFFVLLKPFFSALVLNLSEFSAGVGEKVANVLRKSSDFPIAQNYFSHKICLLM